MSVRKGNRHDRIINERYRTENGKVSKSGAENTPS